MAPLGTIPNGPAESGSKVTNVAEVAASSNLYPTVPGYEVLTELGRGSMGVVYKARQADLHRLVALKMIRTGAQAGREELQRFIAEARVLASLQHPNIIQIYEINLERDAPYFSMELVEGGNLADWLGGRPQPHRYAAQLVETLARAIHVAHQNGIIHRDLKPANVLLAAPASRLSHLRGIAAEIEPPLDLCRETPKITDFGLAKQLHADAGQTESGMIMGTPSYMAPEQAEGRSREVGPAADIYALGAVLYEMLTGRPPFTAESPMETVLLLFQAEPVAPSRLQPRVPRDLEVICLKCLHKEPHRRYGSAEELAADLRRFLSGEPIRARPQSFGEKAWKWARWHPALATLAGCAALTVLILLGLIFWHQVDLQVRLSKAHEEEQAARQAQQEAGQREHLGQQRDKVKDLLRAGEKAVDAQDWRNAQLQLIRARDQAGEEPELADLRERIEQRLRHTDQHRANRERLQQFRQRRDDAFFYATLFTGADLASTLHETRSAAREALALFGVTPDTAGLPDVNGPYYAEQEKASIVTDCYELLLVLAEATAQPLPGQTDADRRRQADGALGVLDRAARLGIQTQAYHRRRAHYLAQAGRDDEAKMEHQRAELIRPSGALDSFLLGEERYRQNDGKQAVLAFENVLQAQPDHFWAQYYLALCGLKMHHPEQTIARLTACVARRPDFPWLYLLRGSAWGELGQYSRAEADFDAALKGTLPDAAHYALFINRGVLRIRQGRLDSAAQDLRQAIALKPQQYQGYVNLAQAYLKGQRLEEALGQLDEAIRREPNLAMLYRTRFRIHVLRQDRAAALADLDKAIALESHSSPVARADDFFERGRLLVARKDYAGAVSACDVALRLRPHEPRVCRLRAEALLELNRLPEALQALDDCLQHGPADAAAFRARAALRLRLGQYAGAQADCTRALELEPSAATYAARGWSYLVGDAPRLALPDFAEAIRLAPQEGDAYAGRGFAQVLLGHYRQGVADAEKALRCGPRTPRLCYNVTRIYARASVLVMEDPALNHWTGADRRDDWRERGIRLLTQALDMQKPAEAERFWRSYIQGDPFLNPIRRTHGFRQLAERFSPRRVQTFSGKPASTEQ